MFTNGSNLSRSLCRGVSGCRRLLSEFVEHVPVIQFHMLVRCTNVAPTVPSLAALVQQRLQSS